MPTHLSLFSGIGGLDLAAEWAGFETVGQCEFADYPTRVLEKHWPDVHRWRDIRTLTKEDFFERTGLHTVDIISGGFPCQPFSVAGKQKGKGDDRYLWPEMLRVIRELAPSWVIGENVPGILRIAGRTVCEDLERERYAVTVFNFEAAAVGAPHRRERVFFVGYAKHNGSSASEIGGSNTENAGKRPQGEEPSLKFEGTSIAKISLLLANARCSLRSRTIFGGEDGYEIRKRNADISERPSCSSNIDVADTLCKRLQGGEDTRKITRGQQDTIQLAARCGKSAKHWAIEPDVGRVANGIPSRVDRLKCLGNAVVPQQAYPIFAAIAQLLNKECESHATEKH